MSYIIPVCGGGGGGGGEVEYTIVQYCFCI